MESDRSLTVLGPRLRQHHSHHQKPSVERHWATSQELQPNREKYQWLSAPVCQGRNVWNQTLTQHTSPWTDPPACGSPLHRAPRHISYSFVNSLSTDACLQDGLVCLYSEMNTAKSHTLHWSVHSFPLNLRKSWNVKIGNHIVHGNHKTKIQWKAINALKNVTVSLIEVGGKM